MEYNGKSIRGTWYTVMGDTYDCTSRDSALVFSPEQVGYINDVDDLFDNKDAYVIDLDSVPFLVSTALKSLDINIKTSAWKDIKNELIALGDCDLAKALLDTLRTMLKHE